ncbi:PilZ domain-containing protein [Variovorax paradoxus]|uniref:PilZ domain-containing protein n=1 Tax=Variovorax paradoxus TaxID=34073 RepID=UPI003D64701D
MTSPAPLSSASASPQGRPTVLQLAFRDKAALAVAYIPFFSEGGVFVPTTKPYRLGDEVFVLLMLPEDPQRYHVAGKVAWINPPSAAGSRTPGVGVRFPSDDKSRQVKELIEHSIGAQLAADRTSQTI